MPAVSKAHAKHAKDGLVILGFNSDSAAEQMNDYLTKNGYDWPQWFMGKDREALEERYWVSGYPTNLLVGRDGKILSRSIRLGDPASEQLIDTALKRAARGEAGDAERVPRRQRD